MNTILNGLRLIKNRKLILFIVIYCLILGLTSFYKNEFSFNYHEVKTLKCPTTIFNISDNFVVNNSFVNCASLFQHQLNLSSKYLWCHNKDYSFSYDSCEFSNINTYKRKITEEERQFPLAFSILMHEGVEQFERLLRAIYRSHNIYCIHVDSKSTQEVKDQVKLIASCLENVHIVPDSIKVFWSGISVLKAELKCVRLLLNSKVHWKYYINLTGREYPLKTNKELVSILKAYNGSNDIDGSPHKRPIVWTKYVWVNENWRTSKLKDKPPHGFLICKGSTHIIATRGFIRYAIEDQRAIDLLSWMNDIRVPDEHFWSTLNHNPTLDVPGAYKGDPDLKYYYTRLKIWQSKEENCSGRWYRFICQFGCNDLRRIGLSGVRPLFLNKIHMDVDNTALRCLEHWYDYRIRVEQPVDIEWYSSRDFVMNHN